MDNTAQAEAPITDQDTLNQALAPVTEQTSEKEETAEQAKPLYLGKYQSPEELEKAYTNIQARATKAEQRLKEIEQEAKKAQLESLKSLGYDEQMQFVVDKVSEVEKQNEELRQLLAQSSEEATAQSDAQKMEEFISSRPELIETGMDKIFRTLAQNPNYKQFTYESIFEAEFEPAIKKLMGTRVSVKERPLKGSSSKTVERVKDISQMSKAEYEQNRAELLRNAGVTGI
jgi:hypothetical protein